MKHVCHRTAGCNSVYSNLLGPTILRETSDECVDGRLRSGIKRVFWDSKVAGRIRTHQNNSTALPEVLIRFPGNEELSASVDVKDTIEFLLEQINSGNSNAHWSEHLSPR